MTAPLTLRRDLPLALLTGAFALAVYVRTLAPFLLPLDSGEFQVLIHQLGSAHTTGYSTYLLLGHLFERLFPWGDVAYRVNLFSAAMAAVTVALVYLCGVLLSRSRPAAVVGALCLATGFTFWSQAIIAEVYSTGAAFLAGVLLCVLLWYRTGARLPMLLGGLLGGLGLGAHSSVGLLGIAVGVFLLLNWGRRGEWLLPGLAGAVLGVALYAGGMFVVDATRAPANVFNAAYTPSRSKWGLSAAEIEEPTVRVWFLVSARQWRSAMFRNPLVDTGVNTLRYVGSLGREFTLAALALALAGAGLLARRDWRLCVLVVGGLLLQLLVYTNYAVGDRFVFFIPTYVLAALLAAVGLAELLGWIARRPWGKGGVPQGAIALAVGLLCLWPPLQAQWPSVRDGEPAFVGARDSLIKADTAGVQRIAPLVTAELEENALVFTNWYWLYPYYYAAHIEQGKTGIQFVETSPQAEQSGLAESLLADIDEQIAVRPIYLTERDPRFVAAGYTLYPVPRGPVTFYRLEPRRN